MVNSIIKDKQEIRNDEKPTPVLDNFGIRKRIICPMRLQYKPLEH